MWRHPNGILQGNAWPLNFLKILRSSWQKFFTAQMVHVSQIALVAFQQRHLVAKSHSLMILTAIVYAIGPLRDQSTTQAERTKQRRNWYIYVYMV